MINKIQALSLYPKFPIKCIMELIESHLNQYFGIQNSQIVEWKNASAQQNESLILWILKNKKIDIKKYEDWSFKYYKIPRLKMSYFEKRKLDQNLLNQYQITWPDHVFPVKKWKDVLYLTCLEPVKEINISEEIQWVLAPVEGILLWKTNVQQTRSSTTNDTPPTTNFKSIDFGSINFSSSEKPVKKTTSPVQKATSQSGTRDLNLGKIDISLSESKKPEATKQASTEEILRNQKNTVSTSLFKKVQPIKTSILNSPVNTSKITSISSHTNSLKSTSIHKPISRSSTHYQEQKILPLIKINQTSNTSQISHDESTIKQGHPIKKDVYDVVLNNLSVIFDQSMILIFRNSILKPERWDKTWNKNPSTHIAILLNKPSVFQIVYKTKQKYHGYVAPSAVNDVFFKTWNLGKYPEHLTLLPLIKKNTTAVAGMLLGATSKEKGESLSLDKLDVLALEASEKLIK